MAVNRYDSEDKFKKNSAYNIAVFVPHAGCENTCSFCNQRAISGESRRVTPRDVKETCELAISSGAGKNSEIAFFGGSFTALDRDYMLSLLEAAKVFIDEGFFSGIRISTRPDKIDREVLKLLSLYGVTAIELGAQSMEDDVLEANLRGHTAADVEKASALIKSFGFSLGLQMMTGLYKSSPLKDIETAKKLAGLKPDTMRVYPTVVLKNTLLATLCITPSFSREGVEGANSKEECPFEYCPPNLRENVELAARLIVFFEKEKGIPIIRLGLHAEQSMQQDMLMKDQDKGQGGYHPAFRELCEGYLFRKALLKALKARDDLSVGNHEKEILVEVPPKMISRAVGHKKENLLYFEALGYNIKIKAAPDFFNRGADEKGSIAGYLCVLPFNSIEYADFDS